MPIPYKILRVERTMVVVSGKLPKQIAKTIFADVAGEQPVVEMRYGYDSKTNQTTIRLLPCRILIVKMPKDIRERYHVKCSCERKIIMPGILPKSFDLVEKSWMPAKRDAKKNSSALRWVTMYPPRRFKDKEQSTFNTEIAFVIETYSYDPKTDEERGCKVENIPKVLRKASELMADELRKLVSSDDGDTMVAAKMLDDISMRFSEALEKTLFDR